jgi:ABC-type phosphate/phosphonate transport system substrate-binding protein
MLFHARERIDMSPDDFAIVAQTGAIPYGPYVARATLDGELLTALKRAFLAVAPGSDVAATVFDERSFLRGFEEAADTDYDVLRVVHQDATGAR